MSRIDLRTLSVLWAWRNRLENSVNRYSSPYTMEWLVMVESALKWVEEGGALDDRLVRNALWAIKMYGGSAGERSVESLTEHPQ